MLRSFSLLVENKPGALMRVAGVMARTGSNIDSLTVSPTSDPAVSRMAITAEIEEHLQARIVTLMAKEIHVLVVRDITEQEVSVMHFSEYAMASA